MDGATILFKRGPEANLPQLQPGEPAFALDTENFFIGSSTGNRQITGSTGGGGGSFNGGSIASALGIGITPASNLHNNGSFYNNKEALFATCVTINGTSIVPSRSLQVNGKLGVSGSLFVSDYVEFGPGIYFSSSKVHVGTFDQLAGMQKLNGLDAYLIKNFTETKDVLIIAPSALGAAPMFVFNGNASFLEKTYYASTIHALSMIDVANNANFASAVRVAKDLTALSALTVANNATFASNVSIISDLTVVQNATISQNASVLKQLHVASGIQSASKITGLGGLEISGSINGLSSAYFVSPVGIGTTEPAFPLELRIDQNGNTAIQIANDGDGASRVVQYRLATGTSAYAIGLAPSNYTVLPDYAGYGFFDVNTVAEGLIISATKNTGNIVFRTQGRATANNKMTIALGVQVGTPTGGDKGAGTINVSTNIYRNNSAYSNPDYALEKWATGSIIKYKDNEGAKEYSRLSLDNLEKHIRENWRLPRIPDKPTGIFTMADIALEKIEELTTYVIELKHEIDELKKDKVRKDETL